MVDESNDITCSAGDLTVHEEIVTSCRLKCTKRNKTAPEIIGNTCFLPNGLGKIDKYDSWGLQKWASLYNHHVQYSTYDSAWLLMLRVLTIWCHFTALLIKRHSYGHCHLNSILFNATVLSHHQFQNFVEGNRSAVRWLSRGVVLRTFSFVDQIRYFHRGKEQNGSWLLHLLWTNMP